MSYLHFLEYWIKNELFEKINLFDMLDVRRIYTSHLLYKQYSYYRKVMISVDYNNISLCKLID